jgi:pimeloyl-CoA synthetase
MKDRLQKIEPEHRATMNAIASVLDDHFNGDVRPKKIGFVLLMAEFGKMEGGRVNFISNANRNDTIAMLKEWLARAEGRYQTDGGRA